MLGQKEERQIRQWAREEYDKKEAEWQAACLHTVSGTLKEDGVYCDDCHKRLDWRDEAGDEPGRIEQRGIDAMRRAR